MTSQYEIRNVASSALSARSSVAQKKAPFENKVSSIAWKGDIYTAFKSACSRTNRSINTLLNNYNTLSSRLSTLASNVERAEREEQAKLNK